MALTSQQVIIGSWHPTQSNKALTPIIIYMGKLLSSDWLG